MGSIFGSLINSTGALKAYSQAFSVLQNNIANANTPGYVKQDQVLISLPFAVGGAPGGVLAGPVLSARSAYLERTVQYQQGLYGNANQRAGDLGALEAQFSIAAGAGIPNGLNKFFAGFSALAVNPNDPVARQGVLELASSVATQFQQAGLGLKNAAANIDTQTRGVVADINTLATRIASVNAQYRQSASAAGDAGLDAQLHAALEDLSGLTNFSLVRTPDGAANVYLGGQSILVQADHANAIRAAQTPSGTKIYNSLNEDITGLVQGGSLHALLTEKNVTIPGYSASLDALAVSFADAVNTTLAGGVDRNGLPPAANLFTYNPTSPAISLGVNNLSPNELAAAVPGAPGGNGNALAISQLANAPVAPGGVTFSEAYGEIGSRLGRDLASAQADRSQYQDTLAQSHAYRAQESGVSLDEEATKLIQFQQSYQAVGKLIGVLSSLTDVLMSILR